MILKYKNQEFAFKEVPLFFYAETFVNVFADKNNKTLFETIKAEKYKKFEPIVINEYPKFLNWPLGKFILKLKNNNDNFYLRFLNKYGDSTYCHFEIQDTSYLNKKGLYIYYINSDLKYIGSTIKNFKNRINSNYGKIQPKNCYIDGQATNCHLNYLIAQNRYDIKFAVLVLNDNDEITLLEKELISSYKPKWNLQL